VGAVLAEDFDGARVVGCDDDVAVGVGGAGDVGWALGGSAECRVCWGWENGAGFCGRFGAVHGFGAGHECDGRRVAEIKDWVF
jgi:hypothetical protein